MIKNVKIVIIYAFKSKFYQYFVFANKNTPQICFILHQFNLTYCLFVEKNWWRLNISLALIWSLKNGSFSTIFKVQAKFAILSHILTPQKVKKEMFNCHQFLFRR